MLRSTRNPTRFPDILVAGIDWWPLKMARELDDAILMLRSNELEIGTWILKTRGDSARVLEIDATLAAYQGHWFVRETLGLLRRTPHGWMSALALSSLSSTGGSRFAGTLLELALAADRTCMLSVPDRSGDAPRIALSSLNFGAYPSVARTSRIEARFYGDDTDDRSAARDDRSLAEHRGGLGAGTDHICTRCPRLGRRNLHGHRRAHQSLAASGRVGPGWKPSNLRFGAAETMETRVFARLSAWQNWIFIRPNAVGDAGALKVFGTGNKARFNWERV